jgi:diguanylate cyclase (GGDEF)-like protein/PAS domain S-box-containing protein
VYGVQRNPALPIARSRVPWLRSRGYAVRLTQCFLFEALATVFVGFAPLDNLIWVANGVLLAYLLLAPRKRWPGYLAAGFLAQVGGSALVDSHWQTIPLLAVLNLCEVLLGALLLRRRSNDFPRFTDRNYLIRFIAYAVLVAPLAAGLVSTLIFTLWLHSAPNHALVRWVGADGLGAGVATPACVAIFRTRFRRTLRGKRHWKLLLVLAAVTLAAFSQTQIPLVYIVYPVLLLVLLRQGLGWAALATIYVAGVGSWFTIRGQGPFALSTSLTPFEPSILLQIFIASGMFMLYSVSVILESERVTKRSLQKIAALHTLVTENSRDVIIVADFEGHRSYVSPAAQTVCGWNPEQLIQFGSFGLLHPEDSPGVEAVVRDLRSGGDAARIECRAKKQDGEYIWVEASLRVIRDPATGVPTGILNILRDISERKQTEQKLQEAYAAVEALSVTDALTGLANRRQFDQCLTTEWRRGTRDHNPLSLLMVDVDLFKLYNDTYGHLRGDTCLKQIADVIAEVVTRSGDLAARFGGEEFAIILPGTGNDGAMLVARQICDALRSQRLPHSATPCGITTISVGCATIVPRIEQHPSELIGMADEALYRAKRGGRDRVCNGNLAGSETEPLKIEPLI